MSNNLKIKAGYIISETKLSKETKLQLLKFIQKEATDPQIKVLLMDGQIVQLDKQAEEIANDRFKSHKLNEELITIAGLALAASLWPAYRALRAKIDKRKALCGTYGVGVKRKICALQVNADENKEILAIMTKGMADCKNAKNPEKCLLKHRKAIAKLKVKIELNMRKLNKYKEKDSEKAQKGIDKAKTNQA